MNENLLRLMRFLGLAPQNAGRGGVTVTAIATVAAAASVVVGSAANHGSGAVVTVLSAATVYSFVVSTALVADRGSAVGVAASAGTAAVAGVGVFDPAGTAALGVTVVAAGVVGLGLVAVAINGVINGAFNRLNNLLSAGRNPLTVSNAPQPGPYARRITQLHIPDENIPKEMLCLISSDIMSDPVYFDGRSNAVFDRAEIIYSLSIKAEDPFTRLPSSTDQLIPHTELKTRINNFLKHEENKRNRAATLIQSHFRGFFARKNIKHSMSNELLINNNLKLTYGLNQR